MTKRTKVRIWSAAIIGVAVLALIAVSALRALKGFDARKEDPQKLFMFYVQKPIPPGITVERAVGSANFGGTCITFRLKISSKALDDLIASKRLDKTDSIQEHLFADRDLAELKSPEFYATDRDMTWSKLGTVIRMAADRDVGLAFYIVFSS